MGGPLSYTTGLPGYAAMRLDFRALLAEQKQASQAMCPSMQQLWCAQCVRARSVALRHQVRQSAFVAKTGVQGGYVVRSCCAWSAYSRPSGGEVAGPFVEVEGIVRRVTAGSREPYAFGASRTPPARKVWL